MPDGAIVTNRWMSARDAREFLGLSKELAQHVQWLSSENRKLVPYEPTNRETFTTARVDRRWVLQLKPILDCGFPFNVAIGLVGKAIVNPDGSITIPRQRPSTWDGAF